MTSPPCSFDLFSRVSNFCKPCLECIASRGPPPASFSSAKAAQGEDETRDEGKGDVVVPAVNQLQFHAGMPGSDPKGLVSYSVSRGIAVQAYSPLGNGALIPAAPAATKLEPPRASQPSTVGALASDPLLAAIGRAHGKSAAQVALRYILQKNVTVATQSTSQAAVPLGGEAV